MKIIPFTLRLCLGLVVLSLYAGCVSYSYGPRFSTLRPSVRGQQGIQTYEAERVLSAKAQGVVLATALDAKFILSTDDPRVVVRSSNRDRLSDLKISYEGDALVLYDKLIQDTQGFLGRPSDSIERLSVDIYLPSFSSLRTSGACIVEMPEHLSLQRPFVLELGGASLLKSLSVQAPTIKIGCSGASALDGVRVESKSLSLDCSGASNLVLEVQSLEVSVDLSGASSLNLVGVAKGFRAGVSGSSVLAARGLMVDDARVDLSGSSQGRLSVHRRLDYDISGASELLVWGSPRIGVASKSGSSSFRLHR